MEAFHTQQIRLVSAELLIINANSSKELLNDTHDKLYWEREYSQRFSVQF